MQGGFIVPFTLIEPTTSALRENDKKLWVNYYPTDIFGGFRQRAKAKRYQGIMQPHKNADGFSMDIPF